MEWTSLEPWMSFGLPQLLTFGMALQLPESFQLNGGFGGFYMPIGSARSLSALNAVTSIEYSPPDSRWHIGSGLWLQNLGVSLPLSTLKADPSVAAPVANLSMWGVYFVPEAGWDWYQSSKLRISSNIGLRIPLLGWGGVTAKSNDSVQNELASDLQGSSTKVVMHFANLYIPQVTFFRLNYSL
jgi:hypothetical protein